jgi:LmbE family N-acetylglucosaminyl deacetylase
MHALTAQSALDSVAAPTVGADLSAPALPHAMAVFAHPDDEVVSIGSRLPRLRDAVFVHVTDGAPRNESDARAHGFDGYRSYAAARRDELHAAIALAGIEPGQLLELDCPDQEASLHLVEITRRLVELLAGRHPAMLLTHPYEGGHPDHDATAFAVHAACRLLDMRGQKPPPIIEASSYHNGPRGIQVYCFLPAQSGTECGRSIAIKLTPAERDLKRRMLDCFVSQRESLSYFPPEVECYRAGSRFDFTAPPHGGTLFYENHPWGMTGEKFRGLVREAQQELGLEGVM